MSDGETRLPSYSQLEGDAKLNPQTKSQEIISSLFFAAICIVAFPLEAVSAQAIACRNLAGSIQFLDGKNKVVKVISGSEKRSEMSGGTKFRTVQVYGCTKGQFGFVLERKGFCKVDDDEGCKSDAKLSIYDSSGQLTWRQSLPIRDSSDFFVTRNDQTAFFYLSRQPFGIASITPHGEIKSVIPESENPGDMQFSRISSDGRYAVLLVGDKSYVAYDFATGRKHSYSGPGDPWIKDDGTLEVWVGSVRKDDLSRGPDGQKIYEYKFK